MSDSSIELGDRCELCIELVKRARQTQRSRHGLLSVDFVGFAKQLQDLARADRKASALRESLALGGQFFDLVRVSDRALASSPR